MIWDDLATHGWAMQDKGIDESLWKSLAGFLQSTPDLIPAKIGRGAHQAEVQKTRGDSILWLQEEDSRPELQLAWSWLEALRKDLNQNLYLGLKRFEAHFALYPPGAGYDLHVDQHRGQVGRKITFLIYLNEDWRDEHGGELELHLDSEKRKISPIGGRVVLFRSELIPHQVHPAVRARKSLTGWFRDDDLPW